jgi:hypothetical protein
MKSKAKVIGISIYIKEDGTVGLYENGLRQNVIFLYRLFSSIPHYKVYLINEGDGELTEDLSFFGIDRNAIVRTQDLINELDFVLVIGAAIAKETLIKLRERGVKIVNYKGGNGGVISMEGVTNTPIRHDAESYYDADSYDAIWMTPQHIRTYRGWCETIYRCPVYEVPQIWAPDFILSRPKEILDNFMYVPGEKKFRVGVMEPNITIMKTAHMPILVAEAAYQSAPELFQALYVTNTVQLASDPHFSSFCNSLSIFKDGVATVEPRFVAADFLANHADAIITHHWENGLNYLYYEVLYGGYPLIHNSEFIKEYGYYYSPFDAFDGGRSLIKAFKTHDQNLNYYKKKVSALLNMRNPESKFSKDFHGKLLEDLFA